jgi:hypothetical protein
LQVEGWGRRLDPELVSTLPHAVWRSQSREQCRQNELLIPPDEIRADEISEEEQSEKK